MGKEEFSELASPTAATTRALNEARETRLPAGAAAAWVLLHDLEQVTFSPEPQIAIVKGSSPIWPSSSDMAAGAAGGLGRVGPSSPLPCLLGKPQDLA